eukprot:6203746-Pleurochrysis_carterae.AAC.3
MRTASSVPALEIDRALRLLHAASAHAAHHAQIGAGKCLAPNSAISHSRWLGGYSDCTASRCM